MRLTKLTADGPNRAPMSASAALRAQSGCAARSVPLTHGMSGGARWLTSSESGWRAEVACGAVVRRSAEEVRVVALEKVVVHLQHDQTVGRQRDAGPSR